MVPPHGCVIDRSTSLSRGRSPCATGRGGWAPAAPTGCPGSGNVSSVGQQSAGRGAQVDRVGLPTAALAPDPELVPWRLKRWSGYGLHLVPPGRVSWACAGHRERPAGHAAREKAGWYTSPTTASAQRIRRWYTSGWSPASCAT